MNRTILRATTVALSTGALAIGLVAPAVAASEERTAAGWLGDQLTDGAVVNEQYDFTDYGLTIDTATALSALDRKAGLVRQATTALEAGVDSYTTGVDFGSSDVYANAVAKLAAYAVSVGSDPRDFGGVDLVARLESLVSTTPGSAGRLQDRTEGTDYANTLGQAFAVDALRASDREAQVTEDAEHFLLNQQCADGWFRLYFSAADDQYKDCDNDAASAPDTDATAVAVLALSHVKKHNRSVGRAIRGAVAWLAETQRRNGSFGGGSSTEKPNANSTGLAGAALAAGGKCGKARRAARWVARLQVQPSADRSLRDEVGAIAYDRGAYADGESDGITETTRDQWRRATAQAAPVLAFLDKGACER